MDLNTILVVVVGATLPILIQVMRRLFGDAVDLTDGRAVIFVQVVSFRPNSTKPSCLANSFMGVERHLSTPVLFPVYP
jgi:hypothetical protein